jgi:hypothetical protein
MVKEIVADKIHIDMKKYTVNKFDRRYKSIRYIYHKKEVTKF